MEKSFINLAIQSALVILSKITYKKYNIYNARSKFIKSLSFVIYSKNSFTFWNVISEDFQNADENVSPIHHFYTYKNEEVVIREKNSESLKS